MNNKSDFNDNKNQFNKHEINNVEDKTMSKTSSKTFPSQSKFSNNLTNSIKLKLNF